MIMNEVMNENKLIWEYIPEDIAEQYRVSTDSVLAVGDKADYIVSQAAAGNWCCYVLLPLEDDEHYSFKTAADAFAFAEKMDTMTREEEIEEIKDFIAWHYDDARCGLYNSRNTMGDPMHTIFQGEYFTLDISWKWEYFEVFGTNNEEFQELERFYKSLRK